MIDSAAVKVQSGVSLQIPILPELRKRWFILPIRTQEIANAAALSKRYVVEVQGGRCGHPIIRRQDYLARKSPNGSRCRYDNDFVKSIDDFVSREDEDGASFVR